MRHLGTALHALAATATIAAIWTPLHWQFAATALLLFLAGTLAHGTALQQAAPTESYPDPSSIEGPGDANGNPISAGQRPHNNYGTPA